MQETCCHRRCARHTGRQSSPRRAAWLTSFTQGCLGAPGPLYFCLNLRMPVFLRASWGSNWDGVAREDEFGGNRGRLGSDSAVRRPTWRVPSLGGVHFSSRGRQPSTFGPGPFAVGFIPGC
uniref:Uncharacterized protein n=1 Tax=Rousettus aegyptiacus TaxID=9407 RepID=A0A7J8B7G4_ROUAE|nr:hypothetical protein HJG63_010466 [Rousettus aegyptiacus]